MWGKKQRRNEPVGQQATFSGGAVQQGSDDHPHAHAPAAADASSGDAPAEPACSDPANPSSGSHHTLPGQPPESALTKQQERTLRHLRRLCRFMDTAFTIPCTNIRFGFDAMIGLIPFAGDMCGAGITAYIVLQVGGQTGCCVPHPTHLCWHWVCTRGPTLTPPHTHTRARRLHASRPAPPHRRSAFTAPPPAHAPSQARRFHVSRSIMLRMMLNQALDSIAGCVPIVGGGQAPGGPGNAPRHGVGEACEGIWGGGGGSCCRPSTPLLRLPTPLPPLPQTYGTSTSRWRGAQQGATDLPKEGGKRP